MDGRAMLSRFFPFGEPGARLDGKKILPRLVTGSTSKPADVAEAELDILGRFVDNIRPDERELCMAFVLDTSGAGDSVGDPGILAWYVPDVMGDGTAANDIRMFGATNNAELVSIYKRLVGCIRGDYLFSRRVSIRLDSLLDLGSARHEGLRKFWMTVPTCRPDRPIDERYFISIHHKLHEDSNVAV